MHRDFVPAVYLMANRKNGTLYAGVTSHLVQRVHQHREGVVEGFTSRYGVDRLVWFEMHATMETAIRREKQIKTWNRSWKIRLIEEGNPDWKDLAVEMGFAPASHARPSREGGNPSEAAAMSKGRVMDSRLRGNDEGNP